MPAITGMTLGVHTLVTAGVACDQGVVLLPTRRQACKEMLEFCVPKRWFSQQILFFGVLCALKYLNIFIRQLNLRSHAESVCVPG